MIKIAMVHGSLKFTFTKRGLATLITALETVVKSGEFTIPNISFTYAGEDRMLDLVLAVNAESCFKVMKHQICLGLELEDVEDSLGRFKDGMDLTDLYPEWLQAVNLANKKHSYLYVSMEPE